MPKWESYLPLRVEIPTEIKNLTKSANKNGKKQPKSQGLTNEWNQPEIHIQPYTYIHAWF